MRPFSRRIQPSSSPLLYLTMGQWPSLSEALPELIAGLHTETVEPCSVEKHALRMKAEFFWKTASLRRLENLRDMIVLFESLYRNSCTFDFGSRVRVHYTRKHPTY